MLRTIFPKFKIKVHPFVITILLIVGCGEERFAQRVVDNAIEAHGGDNFRNMKMEFDFRDYHYRMHRKNGLFTYERIFTDTLGNKIEDRLTNDGFVRKVNGVAKDLPEERRNAFSNSVNSVFYFALLPYGLNDPAVKKNLIGTSFINGKGYHLVEVTFEEEGGGDDYHDVFYFWFSKETFYMDYLAYTYETDGGGVRFREAVNPRLENGIRIQDYINYKPADKETPLAQLEQLYASGDLIKLSEINLENISVERAD